MRDNLLFILIAATERAECSPTDWPGIPITLTVGGLLISGKLISHRQYMELLGGGSMKEYIDRILDSRQRAAFAQSTDEFIHLASARFVHGITNDSKPFSVGDGLPWRGKLDSVDGFVLGELVAPPSS
ncbi:MAG: hypothetical protein HZA91_11590 [Verrucomicrobia bacterium]|nr:hypothetical protein [Verrucomicrobiota bacterium]